MSVVGIGTPKYLAASAAITPVQLDIVERVILTGGAASPVVNLREGNVIGGAIKAVLKAPINTTVSFDVGIKFKDGLYVEIASGNADITLVMS